MASGLLSAFSLKGTNPPKRRDPHGPISGHLGQGVEKASRLAAGLTFGVGIRNHVFLLMSPFEQTKKIKLSFMPLSMPLVAATCCESTARGKH